MGMYIFVHWLSFWIKIIFVVWMYFIFINIDNVSFLNIYQFQYV